VRKAVFFDLDGTLLPLDMDEYLAQYYRAIKKSGFYDRISAENGADIFESAVIAMLRNDGSRRNIDVFFSTIERMSGKSAGYLTPYMDKFYDNEFRQVKSCTRTEQRAVEAVRVLKRKGYRLILATNPVFPKIATDQRIAWAGLASGDFEYVSYYDNSGFCKPNPEYFFEILRKCSLDASECYFVGNDVTEDMGAVALGFEGFLVLDHAVGDIERAPVCERGDYSGLVDFARSLPALRENFIS
jgi:HAD superfamily hydrolase (TIGR01549 family)